MNRAAISIGAFSERADSRLPMIISTMNARIRRLGGIFRPKTRMTVPAQTPIAYADMKCPAEGMLTCIASAAWGSIPIITNSAAPSAKAPAASASKLFFIVALSTSS